MTRFVFVAALLGAIAAAGRAVAEDGVPTARPKALDAMEAADAYSLEVAVKGVDGVAHLQIKDIHADYSPVFKKLAADQWVADASYTGRKLIPLVLSNACGGPERGSVRVTVYLDGRKEGSAFRSRGLAEDFYILQHLPVKEMFRDWLKKTVPTSADVLLSRQNLLLPPPHAEETSEAFQQAQARRQKAHKVDISAELEPAVTLARAKYDERRDELIGRLSHSLLFYPESKDLKWSCERDGDHVFVSASCSDGWAGASFTVELERADGEWQYRRLLGSEVFKGD
jgi:hypothetical protein